MPHEFRLLVKTDMDDGRGKMFECGVLFSVSSVLDPSESELNERFLRAFIAREFIVKKIEGEMIQADFIDLRI